MPDTDARDAWLALTQEEQDEINKQRRAEGRLPIPTHREWPRVLVSEPITFTFRDGKITVP